MGGLSYPLVWTPVAIVLGVLVLLSTYLAVLALLLVAFFVLRAAVALSRTGGTHLRTALRRRRQSWRGPAARDDRASEPRHETVRS